MTWYDLKSRIEDTAVDLNVNAGLPGYDQNIGWGRVDAERATRSEVKGVTNTLRPGYAQLVSVPFWPGPGLPPNDRSQDWSILFGTTYTNPAAGFEVKWYDPVSNQYLDYADWRVPRVGAGRSYWVKFSGGGGQFTTTQNLGGAHPFIQGSYPVVAHLLPRTPDIQMGQPGHQGGYSHIGTPGNTPINWNRQNIKVRIPNFDGSAFIATLEEAKQLNLVERFAYHWNATTQQYETLAEPDAPGTPTNFAVVHQMMPGEGYLIYTNVECQLLLPQN
jgi:hypothetical protein